MVISSQNFSLAWLPSWMAANAFTIVTLLQISRKVLTAVIGTLRTTPGLRPSPGWREAQDDVGPDQRREEHHFRHQEDPHPQLLVVDPDAPVPPGGGCIASAIA